MDEKDRIEATSGSAQDRVAQDPSPENQQLWKGFKQGDRVRFVQGGDHNGETGSVVGPAIMGRSLVWDVLTDDGLSRVGTIANYLEKIDLPRQGALSPERETERLQAAARPLPDRHRSYAADLAGISQARPATEAIKPAGTRNSPTVRENRSSRGAHNELGNLGRS